VASLAIGAAVLVILPAAWILRDSRPTAAAEPGTG